MQLERLPQAVAWTLTLSASALANGIHGLNSELDALAALPPPSASAPFHLPSDRPDSHAPIGVMGEHLHRQGEWMVSYRYKRMNMDGLLDGSSSLSPSDVFAQGFMVTPTEMTGEMHMLGAMFGVNDDLTLMFMLPYVEKEMDHETGMGGSFTTRASGPGDTRVAGLQRLWAGDDQELILNAGLSLPTGSIGQRDATPMSMGNDVQLPYPMQLGSGTFDLFPGLTWLLQKEAWSFGAQAVGTLRIDENDRGYRLGNRVDVSAWAARRVGRSLSASLRLAAARWGDVHGSDSALDPMVVPTADPKRIGGERVDLLAGLNARLGASGHRLALEVGAPIHQDLNGPQLETDLVGTLGWQFSR